MGLIEALAIRPARCTIVTCIFESILNSTGKSESNLIYDATSTELALALAWGISWILSIFSQVPGTEHLAQWHVDPLRKPPGGSLLSTF